MSVVFDPNHRPLSAAFNGFFITEQSYSNLLDVADIYFKLGPEKRLLQLVERPHMFITSKPEKVAVGVGKTATLRVSQLGYNRTFRSLIAIVQLKNNFTDQTPIPHIRLTDDGPSSESQSLTMKDYTIVSLHAPYVIHGKIGMMIFGGPTPAIRSDRDSNLTSISTFTVTRPELTITVENSAPPGATTEQESEETFQGHVVYKGKRGGKFYYLDGKKRYVTDESIAQAKHTMKKKDVVYNINFLAPLKSRSESNNSVGVREDVP